MISILGGAFFALIDPVAQLQKASDARRKSDLSQIKNGLELYYQDSGKYPPNTADYKITSLAPGGGAVDWGTQWPPYMTTLPKDPSSPAKTYIYYSTGQAYYLYASLDRKGNDPQACNAGANCNSISQNGITPDACGGPCNSGVSSPNVDIGAGPTPTSTPPTPTPTPSPKLSPCPPYGDVDLDGKVSTNDSLMIASSLTGTPLVGQAKLNADVTGDGIVQINDALRISQYLSGAINTFPVCSIIPTP